MPTQILHPVFDVESQRQVVEGRFFDCLVIHFHVVENGLFIGKMKVALHVICLPQGVRSRVFLLFVRFFLGLSWCCRRDSCVERFLN